MNLLSVIESPGHPDFSALYRRLGIRQQSVSSIRKAIAAVRETRPDIIVAEFFYGYGNNYAGVNISNLDVLLSTLQKYAPQARVVVMVDRNEHQYVEKLRELFPLHAVFTYPVTESALESLLREACDE